MRILFVNPPLRQWRFSRSQRSPGVIKSGTMYYPYWLAHAAALAETREHEICLIDCPADGLSRDDLLSRADSFGPELIVVDTSTPSARYDLETVAALKQRCPGARAVLVGTHATATWQNMLGRCPELDFVAIGEFDVTIVELAEALATPGRDPLEVPGVGACVGGEPVRSPARLPIEDMDSLPWIAPIYKRFLTPQHYLFTLAAQPMVMLIGGRGCKARCFYCVYPQVMHGHRYRTRSPDHIVGEMKWIQDNMPEVREIVFEDDTFTADREHAREFATQVKEAGITLPFFANIRTNTDYDTLAALREAGLRQCATGFESANRTILANMRKGQVPQQQHQFMEMARDLGILVHGCFMVGFPGETRETMEETFQLALELDPDSAQFYPVMPYPGTGAYQWYHDNGYLATEDFEQWLTVDGGHRCVLNLPGLPPEALEAFCEEAFRRFHFRLPYLLRKLRQMFTHPGEGRRSLNAAFNFVRYLFSNDRALQAPFPQQALATPDGWDQRIRPPQGRMERVESLLLKAKRNQATASDKAIRQAEQASQRT